MNRLKEEIHHIDICVIGGGMAGICATLAAARQGTKVVLIHDRPVLGGNASSECRVHICGADRHNAIKNMRETGILEEIRMENLYRNPNMNFSVWDTILYDKIISEPNIILLLNCSCLDANMEGETITSVVGWQLTTQTYHKVHAHIFIDCSGDAILAPLTNADYKTGREASNEYNESFAPQTADSKTMGMTCLFQSRNYNSPQPFEAPSWAYRFNECDELPYGAQGHQWIEMGYWWIELGGEEDCISDTEKLRHELLKITFGVWDHIKNRCKNSKTVKNRALEWVQFLPAKRESRRYMGNHILTQNDIESEGKFEDIVAYGGWSMDNHHPSGFNAVKISSPATVFYPAPSPYGIPYQSLYSRNICNLMFAGRDASCSHIAMSSTRVMGTCCSMGQAAGTAAALAIKTESYPANMLNHIQKIQQTLIYNDAYLPQIKQVFSEKVIKATLTASRGDPEPVRDGINRPVGNNVHAWICSAGDSISYKLPVETHITNVTVIVDSALDKLVSLSYHQKNNQLTSPPDVMTKIFSIEGLIENEWCELVSENNNYHRLCRFVINRNLKGIRWTIKGTWGAEESRLYAFYFD